uniref:Type II toxin-antitoxin system RelE/ParE family toxin n=1 Tax=Ascaris lumbricoides TaxID=6252 RepID=A0A0M3HHF3_ASCLU
MCIEMALSWLDNPNVGAEALNTLEHYAEDRSPDLNALWNPPYDPLVVGISRSEAGIYAIAWYVDAFAVRISFVLEYLNVNASTASRKKGEC